MRALLEGQLLARRIDEMLDEWRHRLRDIDLDRIAFDLEIDAQQPRDLARSRAGAIDDAPCSDLRRAMSRR